MLSKKSREMAGGRIRRTGMHAKAQSAMGAVALLIIILSLIIGYILFIPPKERAELLGENGVPAASTGVAQDGKVLLQSAPGRIDFFEQKEIEHALPSVFIFTATEGTVLDQRPSIDIKHGLFSNNAVSYAFSLADPSRIESLLLSMSVKKSKGSLRITLNDVEILNSELGVGTSTPLKLPKSILEEENQLRFEVSSPGAAFWRVNRYLLQNVQVIADVKNVEAQSASSTFVVSDVEKNNVKSSVLSILPECDADEAGKLTIRLNEKEIYDSIPDCELPLKIELAAGVFVSGLNTLEFHTAQGSYALSPIKIETALQEIDFPSSFFDVTHAQFLAVQNGTKKVMVRLDFTEAVEKKTGQLIFNGKTNNFDTTGASFTLDVSEGLIDGGNSVKIKPKKTLEVSRLLVTLE